MVLQAAQDELQQLRQRLEALGVPHNPIIESCEPYAGQLMAIGLRPAPREEVQKHVSSIPLLR